MKQKEEKQQPGTELIFSEPGKPVNYWSNKAKLREFFMKRYDLSEFNFQIFCAFGYSLGANPYAGEIIPVLFNKGKSNEKLSFILTRDFRGRIAQEQSDYHHHFVMDVCENDEFKMGSKEEIPDHTWSETSPRGKLLGAYCIVYKYRLGVAYPAAYVYIKYDQYKKTGPGAEVWDRLPNDQTKKVAEAHGLRQAFYNKFGNTYDSAEVITDRKGIVIDAAANSLPPLDEMPPAPELPREKESVNSPVEITPGDITKIQLEYQGKYGGSQQAFIKLQEVLPGVKRFVDITSPDQLQSLRDAINTPM